MREAGVVIGLSIPVVTVPAALLYVNLKLRAVVLVWMGVLAVAGSAWAQVPAAAVADQASSNLNTACGVGSLYSNTSGIDNTAIGPSALSSSTTGSYNIALGQQAGIELTSGSFNIDIGNRGNVGEARTIRIGTPSQQTAAFVAGVYGTPVNGNAVVVSSTGQLGVVVSSQRYKTDIEPMGSTSARLDQLRPVTYHLKSDPQGNLQYGLLAEEVAKVFPDLVIRDDSGQIDGVRYDELAPILLSELQQQRRQLALQAAQLQDLTQRLQTLQNSR